VHVRTSGGPNGCSRAYTAEIGIVGASVNLYTLYLGASALGTRLGQVLAQNVKRSETTDRLRPIIQHYQDERFAGESFGDFCDRVGMQASRALPAEVAA
jgi:sulfite reductase (ferredoxin)